MQLRHELVRVTGAVLVSLAVAAAQPALAGENHVVARKLRDAGEILSLEKIAERARQAKPGAILETDLEFKKGRYIYAIEVLDEKTGRVWELKLDAKTGELITMELDD
jgi:uncharacterized membrane protein YkoI